jgi:hypothetical protein
MVRPDGSIRLAGFIEVGGERLRVVPNEPARATCADADDDGDVGLTSLTATVTPAGARQPVLVVITPIGTDIDQRGVYDLTVTVGRTTFTTQAEAAYGPTQEVHRS